MYTEIYARKNNQYGVAAAVDNELLFGTGALSLQLQQYFVFPTAVRTTLEAGHASNISVVEGMLLYVDAIRSILLMLQYRAAKLPLYEVLF